MKKIAIIIYYLPFIIYNSFCFAQPAKIDSLKKVIKVADDTTKIKTLIVLAWQYKNKNLDTALLIANQAFELTKTTKHLNLTAKVWNTLGAININKGNPSKGLDCFINALNIMKQLGDKKSIAKLSNNIGQIYTIQGNYPKALTFLFDASKALEELNDPATLPSVYGNIGGVYKLQGDFPTAITYFLKSIEIGEKTHNNQIVSSSNNNIGTVYLAQKKYELAETSFLKSLKNSLQSEDKFGEATSYNNLGNVYEQTLKYDKAIEHYLKSLSIREELKDNSGMASCYNNIGGIYVKLGKFKEAEAMLLKSAELSEAAETLTVLKDAYNNLSCLYDALRDYKQAYVYHKLYSNLKDSLLNEEKSKEIGKIEAKAEYDKEVVLQKAEQEKLNAIAIEEKQKQQFFLILVTCILILVGVFGVFMYRRFKITQRQKAVIEKQKALVDDKNIEITRQKHLVEEHQKEIIDSINYAKRIQYALLAHADLLKKHLPQHFVLFKPKDIVSGDFYWATEHENNFYLAVCDSTGHGVPGAFMSLLNIGFLSEAIKEKDINKPNEILNYVRSRLIESISKEGQKDGMDCILIKLEQTFNTQHSSFNISYAAANNEPILLRDGQLIELPKDKMPVGKGEKTDSFTLHTLEVQKGDSLLLYTDGYADQFGGPKGKKFKYKPLNDALLQISVQSMEEQKEALSNTFDNWKGNLEQVDDVTVIGIKI
ncbi:MAG TPA: tetratricopeptide repeat protein [Bacteroidia bacterium]